MTFFALLTAALAAEMPITLTSLRSAPLQDADSRRLSVGSCDKTKAARGAAVPGD